jgi:hypothetical protein
VPVYTTTGIGRQLRQSCIITNLAQVTFNSSTEEAEEIVHAYSIIMSQDCDLERDYDSLGRADLRPALNGVLIFEMQGVDDFRNRPEINSGIWKIVAKNDHLRYHCLEAVPASVDMMESGLPMLVIDFRRYFTLPSAEIIRQCDQSIGGSARMRCRLEAPYREHLQNRAGAYLGRVALPAPDAAAVIPSPD